MFKTIAYAEVISYILLLVIAVPLKYLANDPRGVKILGPIHGIRRKPLSHLRLPPKITDLLFGNPVYL
jgi:hypothetical protein